MMTINIGLASWIIQDGNYGEFEVGNFYRFAMEFFPKEISLFDDSQNHERSLIWKEGTMYEACGKILYSGPSSWVIDCGVPLFQEQKPPDWAKKDMDVKGLIYIGIDPFFYFEYLKDYAEMPDLFRQWLVRRILLETTPWIETSKDGRNLIMRAQEPPTFTEVQRTNAWEDDDGMADYILVCELQ
jgi:hypothetical protein